MFLKEHFPERKPGVSCLRLLCLNVPAGTQGPVLHTIHVRAQQFFIALNGEQHYAAQ